ncbi:CYTH domain-containing protein [Psychrobacillus vulpis]|uniref:CYTH domain-containing protein n=1 Tax=Psychrobacillus vulpis TaxID=2325572 RepID=A0A544TRZ8_9BACI|nr:CYTH domain-containing protein [Psychrobacillus vulpis]TQR20212.1 CYTH domain-containing protein [Psychrobacillus vulpis]
MHKEKEIEFKNLLTKEEFNQLLTHFQLTQKDFFTQTNYYFDTPNNYFKEKKMGFRLRVLPNRNELTLKIPEQEHIMHETTQLVTDIERDAIIHNLKFPSVSFLEQTEEKGPLICIGSMKTKRAQLSFDNGMLFFDHSIYSNTEDFELEYECNDVENGKMVFSHLLDTYKIPVRHTDKKIARLVNYNNSLKG